MTLTLSDIPNELDAALRRRAAEEGREITEVAMAAMKAGLSLVEAPVKRRDLGDLAGTWIEDPEFDAVMKEQDRIDVGL